jgi:hypothetical protein
MKKTIVFITGFCTLVTVSTSAQFQRGTLMLGTNLAAGAYNSANSDYTYDNASARSATNTNYTFSGGPQLGVFVAPNVVVGGTINYNISNTTTNSTLTASTGVTGNKTTATNYTVNLGPFLRVYFADHYAPNLFYTHLQSDNANTANTIKDSNGAVTTSTNNYKLATGTSGIALGITFHWFLPGRG